MKSPLFTIVTCTYNSAEYLQTNIDSVSNQTYSDFEHIFIDAQSTDATLAIIEEYRAKYPNRVRVYSVPPKGIADAMNKGISNANGEFIQHLHSDDSLYNNTVLEQVAQNIKQHPNVNWFYGKAEFVNTITNQQRVIPHRAIYHSIRYWLLLLTNYIPHQAVFLRKTVFEEYGMFSDAYRNSMDYELWVRLAKAGVPATFIDEIICHFSVRPDSQSEAFSNHTEHIDVFNAYVSNPIIRSILTKIYLANKRRSLF